MHTCTKKTGKTYFSCHMDNCHNSRNRYCHRIGTVIQRTAGRLFQPTARLFDNHILATRGYRRIPAADIQFLAAEEYQTTPVKIIIPYLMQ